MFFGVFWVVKWVGRLCGIRSLGSWRLEVGFRGVFSVRWVGSGLRV